MASVPIVNPSSNNWGSPKALLNEKSFGIIISGFASSTKILTSTDLDPNLNVLVYKPGTVVESTINEDEAKVVVITDVLLTAVAPVGTWVSTV